MIRIVALIERYYHCKGFVYMRDGQDYQVMDDNNSRSLAKHFLLFLCLSRQKTPKVKVKGLGWNSSYLAGLFFFFFSWVYEKVQSVGLKKKNKIFLSSIKTEVAIKFL